MSDVMRLFNALTKQFNANDGTGYRMTGNTLCLWNGYGPMPDENSDGPEMAEIAIDLEQLANDLSIDKR